MDKERRRKFHELLPGEGEPDLSTLLELASSLPAGLIPQAARAVRRSRGRSAVRPRALVALASRLSGWERDSLLNMAVVDVRGLMPPRARVDLLAELAPHLSPESLRRSLAIAGELEDERLRGEALVRLAPHLDEPLSGEALAAAQEIGEEEPRWQTLVGLAPHLSEPLLERALAAVEALQNDRWRAAALISLAPYLQESLMTLALRQALRITSEESRDRAVSKLVRHLPRGLTAEELGAILTMRESEARSALLEAAAGRITDPQERMALVREIGVETYRTRALVNAARELGGWWPDILSLIREVEDEARKTWALVNLASFIPGRWVELLAREALELTSPEHRAWLFNRLLPRADDPLRASLLSDALAAVREIRDRRRRLERCIFLMEDAPQAARDEILGEALAAVESEGRGELSAGLLGRLSLYCPGQLRAKVQRMALDAATSVEETSSRAYALAEVVRYLPEALQQSALAAASDIAEEMWRARALADMVRNLSPELLPRVLAEARRITGTIENLNVLLAELEERVPGLMTESELLRARVFKGATMSAPPPSPKPPPAPTPPPSPTPADAPSVEEAPAARGSLRAFLLDLREEDRGSLVMEGFSRLLASSRRQELMARSDSESRPVVQGPLEQYRPGPARVVSNGFSSPPAADSPIDRMMPLSRGEEYYFWFEVGPPVRGSIAERPESIPLELLPREAELKVALFTLSGRGDAARGIEVRPGADVGGLRVLEGGTLTVSRQPAEAPRLSPESDLLSRRLFFPVRMPRRAGTYRLRCCVYFERTLVQSWLIRARVMRRPHPLEKPALSSRADFTLSRTLAPAHLAQLGPHRLSLLLNSAVGATHAFIFGGEGGREFKSEASIDALQLQHYIGISRHAMRKVSWDSTDEFDARNTSHKYRYGTPPAGKLAPDLARLAAAGYSIYSSLFDELAGGKAKELEDLLRRSGRVQIALKDSPRFIIPAAILYDYPFDSNAYSSFDAYKLCPTFDAALRAAAPLEDCDCFKGLCPVRAEIDAIRGDPDRGMEEVGPVICPSGFWGYRHSLGLSPSVGGAHDAPQEILFEKAPSISVGVTTDPSFKRRLLHQTALKTIRVPLGWSPPVEERLAVIRMLRTTKSHLIYFFCHGGVVYPDRIPFIEVGYNQSGITPSNLASSNIYWDNPHPLVFINGCHTTALEPELAIQFVNFFVKKAGAAGVVGTEITIFEQLACDFGEECLRQFLNGMTIGDAVRRARLTLLKAGNPLGLVYIPYAATNLTLKERPAG